MRRAPSDGSLHEASEQLVREEAAAGREADARLGGHRTARGGRHPAPRRGAGRAARRRPRRARARRPGAARGSSPRRPRHRHRPGPRRPAAAAAPSRRPGPAPPGSRRGAPRSSGGPTPSNAWAPGPTASYGSAQPVGEVVAALVARSRPVRDLVAAEARRRPGGRRRARTARPPGRRPARRPPTPATGGRPRVVGRWSPSGPGDPLAIGVVEGQRVGRDVVEAQRERRVQRRRPRVLGLPGDVVQQVDRHGRRCPPARASATASATSRRPVAPAQPTQELRIERLRAERERGSRRLRRASAATPRSSGPGFASIVTSASAASPKRDRTRASSPAMSSDGSSVGVPPPR